MVNTGQKLWYEYRRHQWVSCAVKDKLLQLFEIYECIVTISFFTIEFYLVFVTSSKSEKRKESKRDHGVGEKGFFSCLMKTHIVLKLSRRSEIQLYIGQYVGTSVCVSQR